MKETHQQDQIPPFIELDFANWPLVSDPKMRIALIASVNAGRMLHRAFLSEFQATVKKDSSEQTPFDEEAELIARKHILTLEPKARIVAEETSPDTDFSGGNFWTIDGIDGTTNFSRRIPMSNFTMAKVENGITRVGTVYDFIHAKLYYAVRGKGAFVNGQRLQSTNRPFNESLISYAPLLNKNRNTGLDEQALVNATWEGMREIAQVSGRFPREFQSGALELAWIASGRLDGFASSWTSPWDLSAGVLLIKESGNIATNIKGEDWQPSFWGVIAGTQNCQPKMLEIIQKHYKPSY